MGIIYIFLSVLVPSVETVAEIFLTVPQMMVNSKNKKYLRSYE